MTTGELIKLLQALPQDREVMLIRDDFPRDITGLEEVMVAGRCRPYVTYYPEIDRQDGEFVRTVTLLRSN